MEKGEEEEGGRGMEKTVEELEEEESRMRTVRVVRDKGQMESGKRGDEGT